MEYAVTGKNHQKSLEMPGIHDRGHRNSIKYSPKPELVSEKKKYEERIGKRAWSRIEATR